MKKKNKRIDGRKPLEIRSLKIERNYLKFPPGSVLVTSGGTKVICTATVENKVPPFRKNIGGWLTAEYGMLPGSVLGRKPREAGKGKIDGRSQEIQRILGRILRSVVDLKPLGEQTIWIDADVIQADGGTRTAAVNGAVVALYDCLQFMKKKKMIKKNPLKELVAAVSCGIINGQICLDLCYDEDVQAEVDLNLAITESGKIVEIQGTAEAKPFSFEDLNRLLTAAKIGIRQIIEIQKKLVRP